MGIAAASRTLVEGTWLKTLRYQCTKQRLAESGAIIGYLLERSDIVSWAQRCKFLGDINASLAHYHQALTVYDPSKRRVLATRFNVDTKVAFLSYRSQALWLLRYSDAAREDARLALNDARELGHAATLMFRTPATTRRARKSASAPFVH